MTPAGTSNELDVQNDWEENTHTHTHTRVRIRQDRIFFVQLTTKSRIGNHSRLMPSLLKVMTKQLLVQVKGMFYRENTVSHHSYDSP